MAKKNYKLEWIRAIACVMVVLIHVANFYCRAYETISISEYVFSVFLNALSRVSVPSFFMISGYLLLERCDSVRSSMKKALRFAVILALWSVVYFLLKTYYTHQSCDITKVLFSPTKAHLWYLYVLIPIYIMLPFLQSMIRGMNENLEHALVIIGAVWFVLIKLVGNKFYYDLPILSDRSYVYYFYLGYYLKKYSSRIKLKSGALISIYLLGSVVITFFTVIMSSKKGAHYDSLLAYTYPVTIINSVAFFLAVLKLREEVFKPENKALRFVNVFASCSFGIYLCHLAFFDIYRFNKSPDSLSAFLALPLLTLCVTSVSFGAVYLWKCITKKIQHKKG